MPRISDSRSSSMIRSMLRRPVAMIARSAASVLQATDGISAARSGSAQAFRPATPDVAMTTKPLSFAFPMSADRSNAARSYPHAAMR